MVKVQCFDATKPSEEEEEDRYEGETIIRTG